MYRAKSLIIVIFAFVAGATLARAQTLPPTVANPERDLIEMAPSCLFQFDTVRVRPGGNMPARMSLRNTGQWCKGSIGTFETASSSARIVDQPNHGELRMKVFDQGVTFMYRPGSGYRGSDRFMIALAGTGGSDYNLAMSVTVNP